MKKLYCDRCGKEAPRLAERRMPNAITTDGGDYNMKDVEFCESCAREYEVFKNTLNLQLSKVKIEMNKYFMGSKET